MPSTIVSIAPSPWPSAAPVRLRFGTAWPGTGPEFRGFRWKLGRNCALSPRQVATGYLALCTVSLAIAGAWWWQGAPYVLGFACLELVVLGIALLVYARHAADSETITLTEDDLAVVHREGDEVLCDNFRAEWVRIEPSDAQGSLIELSGDGRRTVIGRYVRPELRDGLAEEIRCALRSLRDSGQRISENH